MKYPSLKYSLKVWLNSVFASPILCSIIQLILNSGKLEPDSPIAIYPVIIICELIFSLITWLIFWGIIEVAIRLLVDQLHRKTVVLIAGVVLTIATAVLLSPTDIPFSFDNMFWDLMLCNVFCIAAGSLIFKLGDDSPVI